MGKGSEMKYKAVVFDLFGTLVENYPLGKSNENVRQMAAEVGAPQDEFLALWYKAFDDRMKGVFRNYQGCIKHICSRLGVHPPDSRIERAAGIRLSMTINEMSTPREGAVEVLSELKLKGYKTGLISNCSVEAANLWGNTRLAPLIDVAVFSCMEGAKKPDHKIFRTAFRTLGVSPDECLYIADGMDRELSAAKDAGMDAVMLRIPGENDYDQFREEWTDKEIISLFQLPGLLNRDD